MFTLQVVPSVSLIVWVPLTQKRGLRQTLHWWQPQQMRLRTIRTHTVTILSNLWTCRERQLLKRSPLKLWEDRQSNHQITSHRFRLSRIFLALENSLLITLIMRCTWLLVIKVSSILARDSLNLQKYEGLFEAKGDLAILKALKCSIPLRKTDSSTLLQQ